MKMSTCVALGGLLLALSATGCGRRTEAARNDAPRTPAAEVGPEASPANARPAAATDPTRAALMKPADPPASAGPPPPAAGEAVYKSTVASTRVGQPMTLADAYPNYKPGQDDPELESTKTGRRRVVRHDIPLEPGGAPDLRTLLEQAVLALDVADAPSLQKASVTQADFLNILWPEMPQSRPAAGVPGAEAWDFLYNRNMAAYNRHMGDFHHAGLHLVGFKVGHVDEYTNYRLHQDIVMQLETADHQPVELDMVRTVVERNGRFKVYSTRD